MIENTRSHHYDSIAIQQDENGKYVKAYLIQRGRYIKQGERKYRTPDENIKLGSAFDFDYMGATEFECGCLARRSLELSEQCERTQLEVVGQKVWVFYNPDYYDAPGAHYALRQIFEEKWRFQEWTNFNARAFDRRVLRDPLFVTDSWFEIQGGMFWTINKDASKVMLDAIKGNAKMLLAKRAESAKHVEVQKELREQGLTPTGRTVANPEQTWKPSGYKQQEGRIARGTKIVAPDPQEPMHPLRAALIAEGKLRPAK